MYPLTLRALVNSATKKNEIKILLHFIKRSEKYLLLCVSSIRFSFLLQDDVFAQKLITFTCIGHVMRKGCMGHVII